MKNKLALLAIAFLFHATSSMAIPILSDDGSLLTGVDVGGTLYDVMFGDGIVGDVYAGVTYDADREAETTNVSAAIVAALNSIGNMSPESIAGCNIVEACVLYLPNVMRSPGVYFDSDQAAWSDFTGVELWTVGQIGGGVSNDASDFSLFPEATLVTYTRTAASEISAPATTLLFGLGLAGLGISRRKRHAQS